MKTQTLTEALKDKSIQRKDFEAGFDLTDISPKAWLKILASNGGLQWSNRKKKSNAHVYGFRNGYIVTACDPITGTFSLNGEVLIGYASYIGIKGTRAFKKSIVAYIKRYGDYKGYNATKREFI